MKIIRYIYHTIMNYIEDIFKLKHSRPKKMNIALISQKKMKPTFAVNVGNRRLPASSVRRFKTYELPEECIIWDIKLSKEGM